MTRIILLFIFAGITVCRGQTTYLPLQSGDNQLLDRLETKSGRLSDSLFLADKPVSRKFAVAFLDHLNDSGVNTLSSIDTYDAGQMRSENGEWTVNSHGAIDSRHPLLRTFYKKQYDFIHVQTNDFLLVINPVLSVQGVREQGNSSLLRNNSRGIEARGWIAKKIGFYTYCTGNDEIPVSYMASYMTSRKAVPGADYYVTSGDNFNYLQATGYFDFAIVKDHLNSSFGYGKHFIGDGVESLFLGDGSSSYPFLELNTRIWKFQYRNLFTRLTPQFRNRNGELPHKFTAMHHLSLNVTRWLNMGFFEAVISGHPDNYDIGYMNPIIYYRAIEQSNGSPDNELVGYNFKIIAARHLQFYGQALLDEFHANTFFSDKSSWLNKWGVQLGGKYIDALTVKNLDLQAELNIVRPYTYSHSDTIANYTNYNQPLAHPLGSGFEQVIGIASYKPLRNVTIKIKGMYYIKGADTGKANYGNNIFLNYKTRNSDEGIGGINGIRTNCTSLNINLSVELKRNLFIDLGAVRRNFVSDYGGLISSTTGLSTGDYSGSYVYFGVRLNAPQRQYDIF